MNSTWTIKKALNWLCNAFRKKNIASAKIDSEVIVSHALNIDKVKLFTDHDRLLSENDLKKIKAIAGRRKKYEPVPYIIGHKDFFNLSYSVNKNVLIPRPETELLVEEILKYDLEGKSILDIGTGCGNIGITLKKYSPGSIITCTDISSDALQIAEQNRDSLLDSNHIEFIQSDIYSNISGTYDFIISNPPYIPSRDIKKLQKDIRNYEPVKALDGGKNGICFYNRIISNIRKYLNPQGYLFLEINPVLKEKILLLLKKAGLSPEKIKKDYNGLDRVVIAKNND